METLKFKIGDKVRVKSLEWYNENKNISGEIITEKGKGFGLFHPYMQSWCGDVLIIEKVKNGYYYTVTNGWKWYDWMLEDDVVTEEKQEVEQLNQNDMETKEMTKEEIFAYLNDTKILCTSREESKNVQEKLFALGFCYYGEESNKVVDSALTLYINIHNKMQFGIDLSMWVDYGARRIEPNEILAIQIKEEKPKFDPKSLRPFDKVLVRDGAGYTWRCTLFSHIEKEAFICTSSFWKCCIPYNEETKHLVGTTEEEPEFYRI